MSKFGVSVSNSRSISSGVLQPRDRNPSMVASLISTVPPSDRAPTHSAVYRPGMRSTWT